MAYNSFPYSDYHELNLDYLLNKSKEIEDNVQTTEDYMDAAADSAETAHNYAASAQLRATEAADSAETAHNYAASAQLRATEAAASANEARAAAGDPVTFTAATQLTDTSKIYVYVGETGTYTYGHFYYYQGGTWNDGGVYGTWTTDDALSDSSTNAVQNKVIHAAVDDLQEEISGCSPIMLASRHDFRDDRYIRASDGLAYVNAGSAYTPDFVDISGCTGLVYTRILTTSSGSPASGMAFYDSAHEYISGETGQYGGAEAGGVFRYIAVPDGAVYAKFSYWASTDTASTNPVFQVYNAADYYNSVKFSYSQNVRRIDGIYKDHVNLWYNTEITPNKGVNANGVIITANGYGLTDYLDVSGEQYLYCRHCGRYAFYDANKTFISSSTPANKPVFYDDIVMIEVPEGAKYFLVCAQLVYTDVLVATTSIFDKYLLSLPRCVSKGPLTACIIGASIEAGYTHETASSGAVITPAKAYLTVALQNNGLTVTNLSAGGMGFLKQASNGTVFKDIIDNTDFTDFDCVYIVLGSNDWNYDYTLGSASDQAGTGSVCAMMKYAINAIISSNPYIKLFFRLPDMRATKGDASTMWGWHADNAAAVPYTLEEISNAIVTICNSYGIRYFGGLGDNVVNVQNILTVLPDGTHPSKKTMAIMATCTTGQITFK